MTQLLPINAILSAAQIHRAGGRNIIEQVIAETSLSRRHKVAILKFDRSEGGRFKTRFAFLSEESIFRLIKHWLRLNWLVLIRVEETRLFA